MEYCARIGSSILKILFPVISSFVFRMCTFEDRVALCQFQPPEEFCENVFGYTWKINASDSRDS